MLQNSTIHVIDLNQIGDCKMKSLLTTLQGLLVREPSDLTSQTIAKMDLTSNHSSPIPRSTGDTITY